MKKFVVLKSNPLDPQVVPPGQDVFMTWSAKDQSDHGPGALLELEYVTEEGIEYVRPKVAGRWKMYVLRPGHALELKTTSVGEYIAVRKYTR